mmetsp:Transcript_7800/g.11518  ORF Transcript_7800/g.11518 Transcript_7800/m.11518 type:complete len:396 (+) Transcript_7800:1163-2350(+)|eukprot:CAMPEP_0196819982 /NCGR_PEP_ID=MMETSP1362-20130617/73117_1 /TAXON_ID=163516 /ORGANISM="Leptocylindrus danicus, Strain CCMP1856" /LENGTH=395 /DNA_ID=CAMNT_0042198659 /DNA_START=1114 /DNA_END=2301 /DNA_ORIENTATION=+
MFYSKQLLSILISYTAVAVVLSYNGAPAYSPATGLKNEFFTWRGQQIRYQAAGPKDADQTCILVHGLFVNSDHWRKTLKGLADNGVRAYAIDLLGNGYSSKPAIDSVEARALNGENGRFSDDDDDSTAPSVLKDVQLGTANGGKRVTDVDLRHPLGSCYNFYTWAELVQDFTREMCRGNQEATIVCNSIGTMTSLQAMTDSPELFNGIFVVNPNFRELHSAEVPFPSVSMPAVRAVQKLLRENGQPLFDALATPSTVKEILKEPYAIIDAVDDELVDVLLSPLLTDGAADVVFDTLSYSAGPLPEQLLGDTAFPNGKPVWVCYGGKDPWTPPKRVDRLSDFECVENVILLPDAGHCPHDEAPEDVNELIMDFLSNVKRPTKTPTQKSIFGALFGR